MLKRIVTFLFFYCAATGMFSRSAYAYIDSSSMTYLIQILAGVVIAVGAGVGFYWKRIQRYFRKKKEAKLGIAEDPQAETGLAEEDGQDVAEEIAARFAQKAADGQPQSGAEDENRPQA